MSITTGLPRSTPPVRPHHVWPVGVIRYWRPDVPWAALVLVLSGLLGGLLTLAVGRSLGPEVALRVLPVVE